MPNKLTDNDIVKALECCKSDTALCNECPYDKIGECIEKMCADSIDLINRLQAENDRLITECGNQSTLWSNRFESIYESAKETIKAEAYKDILNFLEKRFVCKGKLTAMGYESAIIDIKNHLKEMVGEDKRK